jgi:hypothetical protein
MRRDSESAGAPSGQVRNVSGTRSEEQVRRLVETAIETKAGVA